MSTPALSRSIVFALVDAGLLDTSRADEAVPVVAAAVEGGRAPAPSSGGSVRRRMAELAAYVGGAFVLGAAGLFLAGSWAALGTADRVAVLLGAAAVLAAAGGFLVLSAGGPAALRVTAEAVRRRLTSVLLTGAAAATGFGTGMLLTEVLTDDEAGATIAALLALGVVLAGYLAAPSVVGQAGAAGGAVVAVTAILLAVDDDFSGVTFGLLVLVLGGLWLAAAERGLWREVMAGRVLGLLLALVGAQIPVVSEWNWVGYLATGLVGLAAFGGYLATRSWPYLAAGVAGVTVAVPEAVTDVSGGSLGAAGALLATGVTLLLAALLGLRLRREVHEQLG